MDRTHLDIHWDMAALGRAAALSEDTHEALEEAVSRITDRANSLSSDFYTGVMYNAEAHERRGPTQARYDGDVRKERNAYVGLVHPANYSAMKDNTENNTLLKSIG